MPGSKSPRKSPTPTALEKSLGNQQGNKSPLSPKKTTLERSLSRKGRKLSLGGDASNAASDIESPGPNFTSSSPSSSSVLGKLFEAKWLSQEALDKEHSHEVKEDIMFDELITEAARTHRKLDRSHFISMLQQHGLLEDDERLTSFVTVKKLLLILLFWLSTLCAPL